MKLLFKIALLCVSCGMLVSCGEDDSYDSFQQQLDFQTFLDSNDIVYDAELARDYVFRVDLPEDLYELNVPIGDVVQDGDRISILYAGWRFDKNRTQVNQFGRGTLFTTNIRSLSDEAGWYENPYTEPITISPGDKGLVEGLRQGIPGSREGTGFLLYVAADQAYGGDYVGYVEKGTPVVYEIYILGKVTD